MVKEKGVDCGFFLDVNLFACRFLFLICFINITVLFIFLLCKFCYFIVYIFIVQICLFSAIGQKKQ